MQLPLTFTELQRYKWPSCLYTPAPSQQLCFNHCYHTLQIQVIIPGTWIFAFTLNIPVFLVKDIGKEKTGNLCVSIWPADWMQRAYSLSWKVVVFLSCAVMAGLYSRVVYMLWFKRNDDNGLEHRQKVNIKLRIHAPGEEFFCLFSLGFFFMSGTTNQNEGTDFVQMLCLPSPTCRSVFVLMREQRRIGVQQKLSELYTCKWQ